MTRPEAELRGYNLSLSTMTNFHSYQRDIIKQLSSHLKCLRRPYVRSTVNAIAFRLLSSETVQCFHSPGSLQSTKKPDTQSAERRTRRKGRRPAVAAFNYYMYRLHARRTIRATFIIFHHFSYQFQIDPGAFC